MEHQPVVAGLLRKRAEIERAVADLEREVRRRKAEIMQLDATITLFAPDLKRARREVSRFQRSALFVTGELTRRVQTELREAKGEAISADAMVVEIMRAKQLDMGDGELRVQISGLILRVLGRMLAKGAVRKEGWGADARWSFPEQRGVAD